MVTSVSKPEALQAEHKNTLVSGTLIASHSPFAFLLSVCWPASCVHRQCPQSTGSSGFIRTPVLLFSAECPLPGTTRQPVPVLCNPSPSPFFLPWGLLHCQVLLLPLGALPSRPLGMHVLHPVFFAFWYAEISSALFFLLT